MKYSPSSECLTVHHTPLSDIEQSLLEQRTGIEQWFAQQWHHTPSPFYCSVDVRHAGFKLAPVDTNLFPAGFNHLHPTAYQQTSEVIYSTLIRMFPHTKRVLLIPENHTRNRHYFENIAALQELIQKAGFRVHIGSLHKDLIKPQKLQLPSGRHIQLHPIQKQGNQIITEDFIPDVILSNNDFSSGAPNLLKNITQPIAPPFGLGWASRLKSIHFRYYDMIVQDFAKQFSMDPWHIMPLFRHCGEINFMKREGEDCLLRNSNLLLQALEQKYQQYNIKTPPFIAIKADQGTYGMAVTMIQTPEELSQINRKRRTHMSTTKGGRSVNQVILQEGIPTIERCSHNGQQGSAEIVIYLIGQKVVGAFYRVHPERHQAANLNAPGMYFVPLANCKHKTATQKADRFYPYTVVARLAQLAASHELQNHMTENPTRGKDVH